CATFQFSVVNVTLAVAKVNSVRSAVANSTVQVICATGSPTLNDLARTIARPEGVEALTDFMNNPYN
ncbi:hypothetical protein N9I41_04915, partial [Flavobacteriaceae bacterium]|nr:hypothetical protein [Flavobacteriaceae bacterium]